MPTYLGKFGMAMHAGWEIAHFDGLMNYPIRTLIVDLLQQKIHTTEFISGIQKWLQKYPKENVFAQYNLLGSHDTERILTVLKGDQAKLKLAMLFQFTYPGAPSIYYGDEIGLTGGSDPDCRKTFPWDEGMWNTSLRQFVRKLIWLRRENVSLRHGEMKFIDCGNNSCLAYLRKVQSDFSLVVINPSENNADITIDLQAQGLGEIRDIETILAIRKNCPCRWKS